MKNGMLVSFTVDAYKYGRYKDICKLKGTTPAVDLNRYMQRVVETDNASYTGYRINCLSLAKIQASDSEKSYGFNERQRLREMVTLCMENNPDLIVATDAVPAKMKTFTNYFRKINRVIYEFPLEKNKGRCILIIAKENIKISFCNRDTRLVIEMKKPNEESIHILLMIQEMHNDVTVNIKKKLEGDGIAIVGELDIQTADLSYWNKIPDSTLSRPDYRKGFSCFINTVMNKRYCVYVSSDIRAYEERLSDCMLLKIQFDRKQKSR